jgi:hypothetical protein
MIKIAVAVLLIFIMAHFQLVAASERLELRTTEATLTVEGKNILSIKRTKGELFHAKVPLSSAWKIVLKNNQTGSDYELTSGKTISVSKVNDIILIEISGFTNENQALPVHAGFTISVRDDAFCFSGTVESHDKRWNIKEVNYPVISGIQIMEEPVKIYWPSGLGRCFDSPVAFGSRSLTYPGREGAMPWFCIDGQNDGFYLGIHNPLRLMTDYFLEYSERDHTFMAKINTPVYAEKYTLPDIILKIYRGDWHTAARFYRAWYNKNFPLVTSPEWLINSSGWLLTILKQQNGDVMWPYKNIDQLCDIARKNNINIIGLFGWAHGGHDRNYPDYYPDNLMGGREELKKAIGNAHSKGIRIILYANGRLMDTSTEFYRQLGNETIMMDEKKMPILETWRKFVNSTPVVFAKGCPGSPVWRKTMLDLAFQAVSLGADGIIFDQIGSFPHLCFSPYHDHSLPQEAFSTYRNKMLDDISADIHKIKPDFIFMVESVNDAILGSIDLFHGNGTGFSTEDEGFPELFRYTFPEFQVTQRNRNPMVPREDANLAAVYGLKSEIESRYQPDVDYLLKGLLPSKESYSNIISKPDPVKISEVSPEQARNYLSHLIEFENNHAEFFRHGKFIDLDGIEIIGNDILAKGFSNGNKIGVVAWNRNGKEKRAFSVTVPGYQLVEASEPEKSKVSPTLPLEGNSIRLLIFEK